LPSFHDAFDLIEGFETTSAKPRPLYIFDADNSYARIPHGRNGFFTITRV
jgi:hypothetical protein